MTTINTNYKAVPIKQDDTSGDGDLLVRLKETDKQIDDFLKNNSKYLSDEAVIKAQYIQTMIKAEMAAIEAYGKGGSGGGTGVTDDTNDGWAELPKLEAGWNVPEDGTLNIEKNAEDAALLGSSYEGTIDFEARELLFVAGDDVAKIQGKNWGKDLAIIVTYNDGTQKSWMIKDGVVRNELMGFSAIGKKEGNIIMDFSQVMRVADGNYNQKAGTTNGLYIWGTDNSEKGDVLIGSQAGDYIYGGWGNDKIYGQAGDDLIYGDERYTTPGQYDSRGGDDTIIGGTGADTIYGGHGLDIGAVSDSTTKAKPDVKVDMGSSKKIEDQVDAPPTASGWLNYDATQWEEDKDEDGTLVLRRKADGDPGDLTINMPSGFTMAFADRDEDDLIITFVGEKDGVPQMFRFKIEDFFMDTTGGNPETSSYHIIFNGAETPDFIDFSRIEVKSQIVDIHGNNGEDFILGVQSKVVNDGIDPEKWWESTANPGDVRNYDAGGIFTNTDENGNGYTTELATDGSGQIIVTRDTDTVAGTDYDTANDDGVVTIAAPEDYDAAYITKAGDSTYLILVNTEEKKTIVIKFADSTLDYTKIFVRNGKTKSITPTSPGNTTAFIEPIPIEFGAPGTDINIIDGGGGKDLLFGSEGSHFEGTDGDDEIIKSVTEDDPAK